MSTLKDAVGSVNFVDNTVIFENGFASLSFLGDNLGCYGFKIFKGGFVGSKCIVVLYEVHKTRIFLGSDGGFHGNRLRA